MEITLEKIELVRDRTGVTYKEAKDALEAANGSVVDAIIAIEDKIDTRPRTLVGEQGGAILDQVKEILRVGNVSRIMVKKDENTILNLSLNIGIAGAFFAPWVAIAAAVAICGTRCKVEFLKENGEIIEVTEVASDALADIREKGAVVMEEVKARGGEVLNNVKAKASETVGKVKGDTDEFYYSDITCDYGGCDCSDAFCDCADDPDCSCEK